MKELLNVVYMILQHYILISYMNDNFETTYSTDKLLTAYLFVVGIVSIATTQIYDSILIQYGISNLLYIAIIIMGYEEDVKDIISTYVIFIGIAISIDIILVAGVNILLQGLPYINIGQNAILGVLSKSLLLIIATMLHDISLKQIRMPSKYLLIILSSYIFTIIISLYFFENPAYASTIMFLGIFMLIFWVNIINLYIYMLALKGYQKKEYSETVKGIMEVQHRYMLQHQNSFEEVRKLKHDLNNKLMGLLYLVEQKQFERAKNYIMELNEEIECVETLYSTGYSIVDYILNQKAAKCKNKQIKLYVDRTEIEALHIKTQDLMNIIGNGLDNAIEACEYLAPDKRYISMQLYTSKSYLVIDIKNSFDKSKLRPNFTTTKVGEGHGIGIKSMRESAEKYDGHIVLDYTDEVFTMKAILRNEKE